MPVQALAFDAYGTLCRIGEKRHPYRRVFQLLGVDARHGAELAMTRDLDLPALCAALDTPPGPELLEQLAGIERDIAIETASITLFEDTRETLQALQARGLPLVVISNLAPPYAAPLKNLLDGLVEHFCFSFEIGARKPHARLFQHAAELTRTPVADMLMIGDNSGNDVKGAREAGLMALHLDRGEKSEAPGRITTLRTLLETLGE